MAPLYDKTVFPELVAGIDRAALLRRINDRLEFLLDRDHRIGHGHNVTPSAERAGLRIDAMFPRQFSDKMARDEVAKLGQNTDFASGWGCPSPVCFFHTRSLSRAANLGNPSRPFLA
jgi:hypothetical protein